MSDTPITDLIGELLSAGIPVETILLAGRSLERKIMETKSSRSVDETAERRRAWDRERKAKARLASTGNSTGNPGNALSISSSLSKDSTNKDKVERKKVRKIEAETLLPGIPPDKRRKGHALPADWKPNYGHFSLAKSLGMSDSLVTDLATRMRAWADAEDHRAVARKSNWDQAFSGWMRREAANKGAPNGRGGPRPLQDDSRSASRAAARLLEQGFELAPIPSLLPEPRSNDVRLLPKG